MKQMPAISSPNSSSSHMRSTFNGKVDFKPKYLHNDTVTYFQDHLNKVKPMSSINTSETPRMIPHKRQQSFLTGKGSNVTK